MISISTSQTFRSGVVIFHLRLAYGIFISQLIRYARACSSYECFILRARRLSSKLLKHGYLLECLKSSFRKFYGQYWDLLQQYQVSLSQVLNYILTLDQQWLLNRLDFPLISWPWYWAWLSPNYEWFPWSICNGCAMPAGNAYLSGYLVPSTLFGTCLCSYCWNQIPGTCHVFTQIFTLNTWYFLDLLSRCSLYWL